MINSSADFDLTDALEFYREAFRVFKRSKVPAEIELRYYPYVGVNHTIRIREGKVLIRISDLFEHATPDAHRSLAFILVAKLLGKKVPTGARDSYRRFTNSDGFQKLAIENKRRKGRKMTTSAKGQCFDLEHIFGKLNLVYFQSTIPKPVLTWSARKTFRRLGHYDSTHQSITISRSLDDINVPKFVVEYVVYHEMLHIKHPTKHLNGRRYNHTPEFKQDEEKFMYFDEAEAWIEANAWKLKRNAKKK